MKSSAMTETTRRHFSASHLAAEFVQWWRENVTTGHGAGRGNKKNADHGSFFMEEAEKLTGIKQQKVSKWAKQLEDREKYRGHFQCGEVRATP